MMCATLLDQWLQSDIYLLEENKYLDNTVTKKMIKASGLRNLIVHEYAKIEAKQVFSIVKNDIADLNEYLKAIFKKTNISE